MATGYPTPDEPSEIELQCWKVYLPNDPVFISILSGQMAEMAKSYFWKQVGTWQIDSIVEWMNKANSATDIDTSGECGDMTCEQIVDCIENNPATRDALLQYLAQNGYGTGSGYYDEPVIYNANPLLADGTAIPSCNNDNLFGAITQLTDLMDNVLTDTFQQIETLTNYIERTSLLVSGVPAIGLLPVDEFVEFCNNLIDSISENYQAQYTEAIRDEYRCDLFCMAIDTCEFSFEQWTDYFLSKVGSAISQENLSDALEWFVTGVWEGEQVVHAAHALICTVLAHGSKFFSIDMAWLSRTVTASMNDPDPDWNVLCECGNAWCQVFDFDSSNGGWVSGTRAAGWTATYSDPYWTKSGNPQVTFEFQIPIAIGSVITGISVNNAMLRTSGVDTSPGWVWIDHNVSTFNEIWRQNSNANTHAQTDYSNQTLNYTIAKGNLSLAVNVAGGAHEYRVYGVTLRGTGDNPFGESNCV